MDFNNKIVNPNVEGAVRCTIRVQYGASERGFGVESTGGDLSERTE